MAPVTISASVLSLRATVIVGGRRGGDHHLPRPLLHAARSSRRASELALPEVLALGSWTALLTGTAFLAIYARRVTGETFSMSQALAATQMALAREQQLSRARRRGRGGGARARHAARDDQAGLDRAGGGAGRPAAPAGGRGAGPRPGRPLHRDPPRHGPARQGGHAGPRTAPFSSVVEEAAAPHADRGIRIITRIEGALVEDGPEVQPPMARRPEIIQGLRNLVQNAVDFAAPRSGSTSTGPIRELRVVIGDDGPGYPPDLIGRIGDPFVRRRPVLANERPGYEGMGLGLFIAKTLLERSGARLHFGNGEAPAADAAAVAGGVRPPDRRDRHRGLAARAGLRRSGRRPGSARRQRPCAGLRRAAPSRQIAVAGRRRARLRVP